MSLIWKSKWGCGVLYQEASASILKAEEWKSPDVSQTDGIPKARDKKVTRITPMSPGWKMSKRSIELENES